MGRSIISTAPMACLGTGSRRYSRITKAAFGLRHQKALIAFTTYRLSRYRNVRDSTPTALSPYFLLGTERFGSGTWEHWIHGTTEPSHRFCLRMGCLDAPLPLLLKVLSVSSGLELTVAFFSLSTESLLR